GAYIDFEDTSFQRTICKPLPIGRERRIPLINVGTEKRLRLSGRDSGSCIPGKRHCPQVIAALGGLHVSEAFSIGRERPGKFESVTANEFVRLPARRTNPG